MNLYKVAPGVNIPFEYSLQRISKECLGHSAGVATRCSSSVAASVVEGHPHSGRTTERRPSQYGPVDGAPAVDDVHPYDPE